MSYRSWLKDVTHVNDIDPWHTSLDGFNDDFEKMNEARWEKLLEYWKRPLPIDPQYHRFFNSRLHDSQFYDFKRTQNKVVVSVNAIDADILAFEISDVHDIPQPKGSFLIDLTFHEVNYCTTLRSTPSLSLRYDNIATALPADADFHMTFKRDWFFNQNQNLQWVAQIMAWRSPTKKLDSYIYILVDCKKVSVIDRRLPALKKIFGPNIIPLWNDYLNRIDFPESPAYYPQFVGGFYDYFERRLPAHGLTWEDLRMLS
ncbi:MAG: hypothetical protein ACKVQS_02955 [Fimbriimonadaceae bacterium]